MIDFICSDALDEDNDDLFEWNPKESHGAGVQNTAAQHNGRAQKIAKRARSPAAEGADLLLLLLHESGSFTQLFKLLHMPSPPTTTF